MSLEIKSKSKTLPGGHFRMATGQSLKESFVAQPGIIYEVDTPVELGNITLAKGVCIQLAFKNTKATFYRQVSSPNTIATS